MTFVSSEELTIDKKGPVRQGETSVIFPFLKGVDDKNISLVPVSRFMKIVFPF